MSVWGKRGSYQMVAATAVIWVLISAAADLTRPLIPADEDIPDSALSGHFLKPRASAPIHWNELGDAVFRESRRLDRPVLLVLGTGFSPLSKKMSDLFGVPEVAETIRKNMIAVSVDLEQHPGWRGRFVPIVRNSRGDQELLQVVLLDYEGKVVLAPSDEELWAMGDNTAMTWVKKALLAYNNRTERPLEEIQKKNEILLTGGQESGIPDVDGYLDRLVAPQRPSFEGSNRRFLDPQGYLALLEAGRANDLALQLGPIVRSPAYDVLNGGFFLTTRTSNWMSVEYVKVATTIADMMVLLSRIGVTDDLANSLSQSSFDYLESSVDGKRSWSYETSQPDDMGRSLRYSFSPSRLRGEFPPRGRDLTPREQKWAEEVLGLNVTINPQMSPMIVDGARFLAETKVRDTVLTKLRRMGEDGNLERFGDGLLAQKAYVVGRLLEASKSLDASRQDRAIELFIELKNEMRVGLNDVYGGQLGEQFSAGHLDAYLAYSHAAMQLYEMRRDPEMRNESILTFERGVYLFSNSDGILGAGESMGRLPVLNPHHPDVFDGDTIAMQAEAIMLLVNFARTELDGLKKREYLDRAERYLFQAGIALERSSRGASGLARAALALRAIDSSS